jgi:hypothetical protein
MKSLCTLLQHTVEHKNVAESETNAIFEKTSAKGDQLEYHPSLPGGHGGRLHPVCTYPGGAYFVVAADISTSLLAAGFFGAAFFGTYDPPME